MLFQIILPNMEVNMLVPNPGNSTVITVRKQVEFEAFLKIIKKDKVENWSVIAEALGVREATISEWMVEI